MKFKLNQIYYSEILNELFLVTGVDGNRCRLLHQAEIFPSNWIWDKDFLVHIGDL